MDDNDIEDLAEGFLAEYLESTPEYLSVAEYVDENAEEEPDDESLKKIFTLVVAKLNEVFKARFPDPEI